ncbi:hypothetical protein COW20_01975 [bacterium (Candidatus Blackallbacteria) CG13_big_fil_rev_8_21_14_2_50_49_14]|nr:MAG: hypothetical protein COW20_01975 [bacterium (Candidatus Blackallbacteria) CG13_big_fil_rev_8_21_14_2_50_49_14]
MSENGGGKTFDQLSWDELMEFEAKLSQPLSLSEAEIKRFNYRTILYKMDQQNYVIPLIAEDPNSGQAFLSSILNEMAADEYLIIGKERYEISKKGRAELETMAEQYHSLVEHYDIFAHVDIDNSCFLEPGDNPKEQIMIDGQSYDRFIDLRVAIMRFKGIAPFDMVFLNLLREGRIGAKENWEFDLALGKVLYAEVEEIINSAYTVKDLTDLGKTNENGEIPGSDILKDVIVAGNQINQERKLAQEAPRRNDAPEVAQNQNTIQVTHYSEPEIFVDYVYEPVSYYSFYYDPFYVEPCWGYYHEPWYW